MREGNMADEPQKPDEAKEAKAETNEAKAKVDVNIEAARAKLAASQAVLAPSKANPLPQGAGMFGKTPQYLTKPPPRRFNQEQWDAIPPEDRAQVSKQFGMSPPLGSPEAAAAPTLPNTVPQPAGRLPEAAARPATAPTSGRLPEGAAAFAPTPAPPRLPDRMGAAVARTADAPADATPAPPRLPDRMGAALGQQGNLIDPATGARHRREPGWLPEIAAAASRPARLPGLAESFTAMMGGQGPRLPEMGGGVTSSAGRDVERGRFPDAAHGWTGGKAGGTAGGGENTKATEELTKALKELTEELKKSREAAEKPGGAQQGPGTKPQSPPAAGEKATGKADKGQPKAVMQGAMAIARMLAKI